MADYIVIILLVLHITFIALWAGAAVILSSIVMPSLAKISAGSRAEFSLTTLPLFARFIAITSTGAVLAGVLLFFYETQVATSLAPSSSGVIFIVAGAGIGLIAYILAIGVSYPTANRVVGLLKSTDQQAKSEIPRLQARMSAAAGAVSGLLAVTLVLMVIGASL